MLESPTEYISNHHITGWYHACQEYMFETVFASADSDFALLTNNCSGLLILLKIMSNL